MQPTIKSFSEKFIINPVKEIYYSSFFRGFLLAGVIVVLLALVELNFIPTLNSSLRIGKPSPRTIKAKQTLNVVDYEATDARKRAAAASVKTIYRFDKKAAVKAGRKSKGVYKKVLALLRNQKLSQRDKVKKLNLLAGTDFSSKEVNELSAMSKEDMSSLKDNIDSLIDASMKKKVKPDDVKRETENIKADGANMPISDTAAKLVGAVASSGMRPNYFPDIAATHKSINKAVGKVKPVIVVKQKGEIIVQEGKILTKNQYRTLKDMGLIKKFITRNWSILLGLALAAMVILALGILYLYEFQPDIYHSNRLLLLLSIIALGTVAIAKGISPFAPSILIPIAAASMLATILISADVGILMAAVTSLIISLIVGDSRQYILYALVTSLAGVYLTAHISYRSDLTRAGFWMMLVSGVTAFITGLLSGLSLLPLLVDVGWGVIGGFFATMLTIAGTQFLEYSFNITTDMKLLELANPSQVLLKELMTAAPGTYNHSIITGNLAEGAAEKVGANPLLTRVGAYYHDIGKIRRPFFFIENQLGDNPHDKTKPNLSCLIITAHVKDGVEMARKHHLPKEIVDIINQHHGTGLVTYFYNRAKKTAGKEEISDSDFRYPGEKPRSREAALVMLADASEAAVRTITKPNPNNIEQMIRKIFQAKLEDGQLEQCDLTLGDLEIITKVYAQTLVNMYHSRIEYPTCELPRRKRGSLTGSFIKQPVKGSRRIAGS